MILWAWDACDYCTLGGCSHPSSAPYVRGKLREEFAAAGPIRDPLEAFPFIIGLGLTTLLSSRMFNLDNSDGVAYQKLKTNIIMLNKNSM